MSSGVVNKQYQNLMENNLKPELSSNLYNKKIQRNKFYLISELVSILFKNKYYKESFNNISNLIILFLSSFEKKHPIDIFSKIKFEDPINEYLVMLRKIHSILLNYPNLTNKQKFEYCNIERYFMKLYLKEILLKI